MGAKLDSPEMTTPGLSSHPLLAVPVTKVSWSVWDKRMPMLEMKLNPRETQTPVDFWDRFSLAAPGTMQLLERLGQDDAQALRTAVLQRLRTDFGEGPVKLPAAAYFAGGRR